MFAFFGGVSEANARSFDCVAARSVRGNFAQNDIGFKVALLFRKNIRTTA